MTSEQTKRQRVSDSFHARIDRVNNVLRLAEVVTENNGSRIIRFDITCVFIWHPFV